jgi:hypothetical protein
LQNIAPKESGPGRSSLTMIVNDGWSPAISADRAVARARPQRTLAYVIYTSGAAAFSHLESMLGPMVSKARIAAPAVGGPLVTLRCAWPRLPA